MNPPNRKSILLISSLLLILSGNAFINYRADTALSISQENRRSAGNIESQALLSSSTPAVDATQVINLPLVEQNPSAATPIPASLEEILLREEHSVTETPTATATIFPQQTGATNLPIVLGAIVIMAIIVLAWLLVGRQSLK